MRSILLHRWTRAVNGAGIHQRNRLIVPAMVVIMLVAMMVVTTPGGVAARQAGPPPTIGDIVVNNYDCETGVISFQVPVADLPSVPPDTSRLDYPLAYNFESFYAVGSSYFPTRPMVFTPAADDAPFTGTVSLSLTVPTTNVSGAQPGTGAITSIDLHVTVAYGGFQNGTFDNPTDASTLTYTVDCDDDGPDEVGLVEQLVAALKRVLSSILNR
jgi:hypothetical protein